MCCAPESATSRSTRARADCNSHLRGERSVAVRAVTERDIEPAFATLVQQRDVALDVEPDPFFIGHAEILAALAIRYALPGIYGLREYVAAGSLVSYGASISDGYRQVDDSIDPDRSCPIADRCGCSAEFLAIATCARLSRTDPTVGGDDGGTALLGLYSGQRFFGPPAWRPQQWARSLSFGPPPLR